MAGSAGGIDLLSPWPALRPPLDARVPIVFAGQRRHAGSHAPRRGLARPDRAHRERRHRVRPSVPRRAVGHLDRRRGRRRPPATRAPDRVEGDRDRGAQVRPVRVAVPLLPDPRRRRDPGGHDGIPSARPDGDARDDRNRRAPAAARRHRIGRAQRRRGGRSRVRRRGARPRHRVARRRPGRRDRPALGRLARRHQRAGPRTDRRRLVRAARHGPRRRSRAARTPSPR